jgi:hypothetical protein
LAVARVALGLDLDMSEGSKFYLMMFGIIAGLAVLGGGGYVAYTHYKQRGIRNNNPGNIRITSSAWKGKRAKNTDGAFEQFDDTDGSPGHMWGIRALYKTLMTYRSSYGLTTVKGIITRWAPASENNTAAYIAAVAKAVGKSADAVLSLSDYPAVIAAIILHENGVNPYPAKDVAKAISLA